MQEEEFEHRDKSSKTASIGILALSGSNPGSKMNEFLLEYLSTCLMLSIETLMEEMKSEFTQKKGFE